MTVVPLTDTLRPAWDAFVDAHPGAWFWHRPTWIDYCLAFAPGAEDRSFAVVDDANRLVGICPLVREGEQFATGGEPGAGPVVAHAAAAPGVLDEIAIRARAADVRRVAFRWSAVPSSPSWPPEVFVSWGYRDVSWTTRIIDLTQDESVLWRAVRKSYKALIHLAERLYDVVVDDAGALAGSYADLHRGTVGQVMPRSERTYELNTEWLSQGRALLLGARRRGGSATAVRPGAAEGSSPSASTTAPWAAFVYVFVDKGHAYYGSGPSRAPGVMHLLQWVAMRELKRRGVATYEIGWQQHARDDKGRAIEFFKRGFGGRDTVLRAVEWTRCPKEDG